MSFQGKNSRIPKFQWVEQVILLLCPDAAAGSAGILTAAVREVRGINSDSEYGKGL